MKLGWQDFYERCVREEHKRWSKGADVNDRAWWLGPFRVTTIFGSGGIRPFKTDLQLGSLAIHVFWRPDEDPDPHDHAMDFWTFPLVAYNELVLQKGKLVPNTVSAFRLHHRKAEYVHLVASRADLQLTVERGLKGWIRRPIVTVVWRGRKRRKWGFWVKQPDMLGEPYWAMTPWREYIAGGRARA